MTTVQIRFIVSLSLSLLALAGCNSLNHISPETEASGDLSGKLMGGQQPVVGATIQLYAAGTSGDGSAATPLLNTAVTSGVGGSFTITGDYTCPTANSLIYLVATGGNPGLGSNNPQLSMMAALGQCSSISSSTFINIDEVTTIASLVNLYPFMSTYTNIGSGASDLSTFQNAFTAVTYYANLATGTAPGPALPAGYYASSNEINTLANILATCINSTGGTSGDFSACGQLFALAKPSTAAAPTDIIGAVLDILNNPTQNVTALFNLSYATAPFQPVDIVAPSSWTFPILAIPAVVQFSVPGGTYTSAQTLTLSDTTPGVSIYYTTVSGSTPSLSSTLYTGPITVSSSETINAVAVASRRAFGPVASATYTINITPVTASPTFSPAGGVYSSTQSVTIASATSGAVIRYTTDGSTPNAFSSLYTSPISVSSTEIIQAFAFASGATASPVVSSSYVIASGTVGYISTAAGLASGLTDGGDGGLALAATVAEPTGIAADSSGNFYIADQYSGSIRRVNSAGIISTIVPANSGYTPSNLAVDKNGNVYFVDLGSDLVRKVASTGGTITTVAGNGAGATYCGYVSNPGATAGNGDGGAATNAVLCPAAVAVDTDGNLYIADNEFWTLRKVTSAGIISTLVGYPPYSGTSHAPVTNSNFVNPNSVAVDSSYNVYVGVEGYVFKLTPAGALSIYAGTGSSACTTGNGLTAVNSSFEDISGLSVDASGNLYVSDELCGFVRKVTPAGVISTAAGNPNPSVLGDGGLATSAYLSFPQQTAVDNSGNLLIADEDHFRIRKVTYGAAPPVASAPTLSLAPGFYTTNQTLTLSTTVAGASIYYTLDDTDPATSYAGTLILYTGPITMTSTSGLNGGRDTYIHAITVANGYINSSSASAIYQIE